MTNASAYSSSLPYFGVLFTSSWRSDSWPMKSSRTAFASAGIVVFVWSNTWYLIADRLSAVVPGPTGMM